MSRLTSCSKNFPQECSGCPEYVEENDGANGLVAALTRWCGFYNGPYYTIKRCIRFNWVSCDKIESTHTWSPNLREVWYFGKTQRSELVLVTS